MALPSYPNRSPRYLTYIIMWTLAIMTLMRLVWMQRRTYQFEVDYQSVSSLSLIRENNVCEWPSPLAARDFARFGQEMIDKIPREAKNWFATVGMVPLYKYFCESGVFDADKAVRFNQWIWVFVVFVCALAIRLMGFNWLVCLMVVTTLMSRGRFIAMIAHITADIPLAMFFSAGFTLLILFVRSSSWWAFGLYLAGSSLAVFFHKGFLLLLLIPLSISLLTRFLRPSALAFGTSERGYRHILQIFRDRKVSWSYWNNNYRNWMKISWWSFLLLIVMGAIIAIYLLLAYEAVYGDINLALFGSRYWSALQNAGFHSESDIFGFLDLHYAVSLVLVIVCALRGSLNKNLVWACRTLLAAVFSLVLVAFCMDSLDMMLFESIFDAETQKQLFIRPAFSQAFYWTEPILISLGISVLCQLVTQDLRFIFRADK